MRCHCVLFVAMLHLLLTKKSARNISAMNPVTMENAGESMTRPQGNHGHLAFSVKKTGTKRKTKVSP